MAYTSKSHYEPKYLARKQQYVDYLGGSLFRLGLALGAAAVVIPAAAFSYFYFRVPGATYHW